MRVQNMLFDVVSFWSLIYIIKLNSKFHIFHCKRIYVEKHVGSRAWQEISKSTTFTNLHNNIRFI